MKDNLLAKSVKILALVLLAGACLHFLKPFLAPIIFGALLSMLLLPAALKMERWGANKAVAVVAAIVGLLVIVSVVIAVLAWQVSDLVKNAGNLEQQVTEKVEIASRSIAKALGISPQKQNQILETQKQVSGSKVAAFVTGAITSAGSGLTTVIIVLVYVFLFMYFRSHLKNFVLLLVNPAQQQKAKKIIEDARLVAQKYISGLALMIASLWVMYSIGFSIIGVKNAIFFAILCGLLEIVPFVGNLAGNIITISASLAQGGGVNMVIGILVTYGLVQFIQSYILEPLVVGRVVNLHPMFTIIGIVAGEFIWGIPGMILAIPLLGITKIICDHVEPLKPFGFLLGDERKSRKRTFGKLKHWVK